MRRLQRVPGLGGTAQACQGSPQMQQASGEQIVLLPRLGEVPGGPQRGDPLLKTAQDGQRHPRLSRLRAFPASPTRRREFLRLGRQTQHALRVHAVQGLRQVVQRVDPARTAGGGQGLFQIV